VASYAINALTYIPVYPIDFILPLWSSSLRGLSNGCNRPQQHSKLVYSKLNNKLLPVKHPWTGAKSNPTVQMASRRTVSVHSVGQEGSWETLCNVAKEREAPGTDDADKWLLLSMSANTKKRGVYNTKCHWLNTLRFLMNWCMEDHGTNPTAIVMTVTWFPLHVLEENLQG